MDGVSGIDVDVTVVLPTRDRWKAARRALRSALAQRGVAVEVVVVDDGSQTRPDGIPELDDPRVSVVAAPAAPGVAAARNFGATRAHGAWLAFLDDDDLWAPDKLARQIEAAGKAGACFAWTAQVVVDAELEPVRVWRAPAADAIADRLVESNVIGGPSSVIVRRSHFAAVGGFDESLALLADWDLWLRLAPRCAGCACDEILTAYGLHPSNMHVVRTDLATSEIRLMRRKHSLQLGGPRFWNWVALGYRRHRRPLRAARAYLTVARATRNPRDLARAGGVLLGEGAMRIGTADVPGEPPGELPWLREQRDQGTAPV